MTSRINILIISYNRPERVKNLLEHIKNLNKPINLYLSIDGPKNNVDVILQNEIFKIIKQYSTEIAVRAIWSQAVNFGCGAHCSFAITKYFECVPEGIIIEDDVLISSDFIEFCVDYLCKYKENTNIFGISGFPYLPYSSSKARAFLSKYPCVWGWASWADRWIEYDLTLKNFGTVFDLFYHFKKNNYDFLSAAYWAIVCRLFGTRRIDGWDHQILPIIAKNHQKFLISTERLTENVGFDQNATTMKKEPKWYSDCYTGSLNDYDKHLESVVFRITHLRTLIQFLRLILYRQRDYYER